MSKYKPLPIVSTLEINGVLQEGYKTVEEINAALRTKKFVIRMPQEESKTKSA